MNKKFLVSLVATMAVVVALVSVGAVSGTFAKYTSSKTATSSATVAKWAFKVNDKNIAKEDFTWNLFGTDAKIAPGSSGSLAISLENTSEVAAQYAIDFSITNASSVPLQFSVDNSTWKSSIDDIDVSATDIAVSGTATVTVYWKWVTSTDAADTALGTAATAPTVTVSAAVTASQKVSS